MALHNTLGVGSVMWFSGTSITERLVRSRPERLSGKHGQQESATNLHLACFPNKTALKPSFTLHFLLTLRDGVHYALLNVKTYRSGVSLISHVYRHDCDYIIITVITC